MKGYFFTRVTAVLALTAATITIPTASAQNLDRARAEIPFEFVANHQALPAGCYWVALQSDAILTLTSCSSGRKVGVMVHTANGYPPVGNGSMIFQTTPLGRRLLHVRFAVTNIQSDLSVQRSKQEREWAWNKAEDTVTIAMK